MLNKIMAILVLFLSVSRLYQTINHTIMLFTDLENENVNDEH